MRTLAVFHHAITFVHTMYYKITCNMVVLFYISRVSCKYSVHDRLVLPTLPAVRTNDH